jgi:hypothetical protein
MHPIEGTNIMSFFWLLMEKIPSEENFDFPKLKRAQILNMDLVIRGRFRPSTIYFFLNKQIKNCNKNEEFYAEALQIQVFKKKRRFIRIWLYLEASLIFFSSYLIVSKKPAEMSSYRFYLYKLAGFRVWQRWKFFAEALQDQVFNEIESRPHKIVKI